MLRGLIRYTKQETVTGLLYMLIAGILFIVGLLVCSLISIIGWVFAIIGFFKIYKDRYSFPQPHRKNMTISLIFYILGIVISIIGVILTIYATFSWITSIFQQGLTRSEAFDAYLKNLITAIILVLIGSLFTIFARYKLLIELMPLHLKGFLKIVTFFTIIVIFFGFAVLFILFDGLIGTYKETLEITSGDEDELFLQVDTTEQDFAEFQEKAYAMSLTNTILSLTSQILFLLCFYFAWSYQKTSSAIQKSLKLREEEPVRRIKRPPQYGSSPEEKRDILATSPDKIKCPGCNRYLEKGFMMCPDCFTEIPQDEK